MTQNDLLLVRGLAALDIPYSGAMVHRLITYTHELERWNPVYGLVKAEGEDLIVKHILDSLAPWRILVDLLEECDVRMGPGGNAVVSDIGTGAGLPGIPLSIVLADRQFRLIDRMGKRITFLENQKALLQLENVSIEESEIERAAGGASGGHVPGFQAFFRNQAVQDCLESARAGRRAVCLQGENTEC